MSVSNDKKIIGIDLGTTNSEVAVIIDGKAKLLKVDGSKLIPSVISIEEDGKVFVGLPAVNNELANIDNTIRLIKRKMGKEEEILLQGKKYTPPMVSSLILARLKAAAEEFYGEPVMQAVITVPAFFNEQQREATKLAGEMAGLEVLRLLNEPTAAALAYSLGKKNRELSLVYDLGGGTFDVSIVDLSDGVMEVRASDGDVELGGSDFDKILANRAKEEFLKEHGIDLSENPLSWMRLLRAAEAAKIVLSSESEAMILEEFIAVKEGVALHLKYRITRVEFENMIRGILERTIQSVKRAMAQACCEASMLDKVILVGGSTYIPLVTQMLEAELKIAPQAWLDPETVVAQGAAVEGATLAGKSLGTVLLDITPHSLGVKTSVEQSFFKNTILIRRNTTLPSVASKVFYRWHKEQDGVQIVVYQGESERIENNTEIGSFFLEGLSGNPDLEVCIKFVLDRDGLLHVTATDVSTGKAITHEIKRKMSSRLSKVSLEDLKALKIEEDSEEEVALDEDSLEIYGEEERSEMPLNEEMIQKALGLLSKGNLDSANVKELEKAIEEAKAGDSSELTELLYYLE